MGQSTKTMLAQIVAEQLGGAMDRITVTAGDSGKVSLGFGGFNSRQTVMAGSSAHAAATKVREKVLQVASHILEAAAVDLDIVGDYVEVKGAANIRVSLAQVARATAGTAGFQLPGNLPPGIEATESVIIDAMTYSNGCAVAEVEVDVETAGVRVINVTFVHDAGKIINPTIVDGQVAGAIVHGIGNSLFEWMAYGDDGQPLTTNFADYLLPTATEIPKISISHRESPTPLNPLGVKGVGESGVIPIPAAIASAVENALQPFGIRIQEVPIRPNYLVGLLEAAGVTPATVRQGHLKPTLGGTR
jgi:carbon-monoxide dehydrogenase large subunit